MYTTIEAELENGRVKSAELQKLPSVAHVLITWIQSSANKQDSSVQSPSVSLRGALNRFANPALIEKEKDSWAHSESLKKTKWTLWMQCFARTIGCAAIRSKHSTSDYSDCWTNRLKVTHESG